MRVYITDLVKGWRWVESVLVVRCGDCSVNLDWAWVKLVMVHTEGGVSDGCQLWRLFSRPGLGDGVEVGGC